MNVCSSCKSRIERAVDAEIDELTIVAMGPCDQCGSRYEVSVVHDHYAKHLGDPAPERMTEEELSDLNKSFEQHRDAYLRSIGNEFVSEPDRQEFRALGIATQKAHALLSNPRTVTLKEERAVTESERYAIKFLTDWVENDACHAPESTAMAHVKTARNLLARTAPTTEQPST